MLKALLLAAALVGHEAATLGAPTRNRNRVNTNGVGLKQRLQERAAKQKAVPKMRNGAGGLRGAGASGSRVPVDNGVNFNSSVLVFTRFNCAFPFCPTTALDVCSADEHYESGRPYVLATLIPQTPTAEMNFFAYSDFDYSTRVHWTLAAYAENNVPVNKMFRVAVANNGTAGTLIGSNYVTFPAGVNQAEINYFFTYKNVGYVAFATGQVVGYDSTGAQVSTVSLLNNPGMQDLLAATFDHTTGTYWANAQLDASNNNPTQFFLHSWQPATGLTSMLGPLTPPWNLQSNLTYRIDTPIATLPVHPPVGTGLGFLLLEMRSTVEAPFLFIAALDPVTGNSTVAPMDPEWYMSWELDPMIYPTQWPGSQRRVWTFDPNQQVAYFKLYDECGGDGDDCDENESIVYLEMPWDGETIWNPDTEMYWNVAVEPVEPELTQMIWVPTPEN